MKCFKGKCSEGSGGRVRETFFHRRREIFMMRESQLKVVDDVSPTDFIPLGSFSDFCCLFKHWMSLCQIPLLFPGLFVTLRGAETPVPRQANFKGNMGVGQPGGLHSFSRIAGFLFLQEVAVPWGLCLVAGVTQMWSKQLEATLLVLRGCLTSEH